MFKWFVEYKKSTSQTKYFVLTWLVYGVAIVLSTIYCYARLDFVRSGKLSTEKNPENSNK